MLTRLKVSGFKNLVDVDVRLGPFTCIAGANGVGKSNLFDAIQLLSTLTERTLTEAVLSVRDESRRTGDVRGIFHRIGEKNDALMSFEAEMILPKQGLDDLGQPVEASITLVRYVLKLGWRDQDPSHSEAGPLEVLEETLVPMRLRDASEHLLFPASKEWRDSVLQGRRTSEFVSTEEQAGQRIVRMHQDGRSGRLLARPASALPRTMLSTVQTGEYPTALLVRREMQSWRLLQLESSALRRPDEFTAPPRMGSDGSHIAATLYHLARRSTTNGSSMPDESRATAIYAQVANRLASLLEDVREVIVDRDETRERFTLQVRTRDGTIHPARDLSDGTLRFLALAVMEFDRQSGGLLCLEEPENGIHPRRVPVMLELLQDMAADTYAPCDEGNPLRQVIVNTHSPSVFQQVPDDSVLLAELVEDVRSTPGEASPIRFNKLQFSSMENTWRTAKIKNHRITDKGKLLAYLNPSASERDNHPLRRRVMDREDMQLLLNMPSNG
ncbi:MAG: AAA family ATPase [Verrucomicrobiota bacterium]